MAHKRYVIKNGRVYGPYLYESYRDEEGNVKKNYLGRHNDIKRANIPFVVIITIVMVISFFMLASIFLKRFF